MVMCPVATSLIPSFLSSSRKLLPPTPPEKNHHALQPATRFTSTSRSLVQMPKSKPARNPASLRGIRRDRDCRNCKTRGVKCDLNRPRCLPCVQSGLGCGGYPQRTIWKGGTTSSTAIPRGTPTSATLSQLLEQSMSLVPMATRSLHHP